MYEYDYYTMKSMKHDYRKKTTWKYEDPGMEPWPGEKPKPQAKAGLRIRLLLALLVVAIVGGIWAHRHFQRQTAVTPSANSTPQVITIPLQIPSS